jgi:hypothetical protein
MHDEITSANKARMLILQSKIKRLKDEMSPLTAELDSILPLEIQRSLNANDIPQAFKIAMIGSSMSFRMELLECIRKSLGNERYIKESKAIRNVAKITQKGSKNRNQDLKPAQS